MRQRKTILKKPRICVGELVQIGKFDSAGQLGGALDSQGTLKKHNSSSGGPITESASSLTKSTMYSSVMNFSEIDLSDHDTKKLKVPRIIIGNLV